MTQKLHSQRNESLRPQNLYTIVHTALFIISKNWKQSKCSSNKCIVEQTVVIHHDKSTRNKKE